MANGFARRNIQGDYGADDYVKTASFVFSDEYTGPILSWLNAGPGDRIVDLGCGSGELTVKIQNAVGNNGLVLGVDYSEDMVGCFAAWGHCYDGHVSHRCRKRRRTASRVRSSAMFRTLNYRPHCCLSGHSMQRLATLHCIGANAVLLEFLRVSEIFSSLGGGSFARWADL